MMPNASWISRIDCAQEDAAQAIASLRGRLSLRGDVVTDAAKARTIAVFGSPLTPFQVVERLVSDVKERGRDALFEYTAKLDGIALTPRTLRVQPEEFTTAVARADAGYIDTLRRVRSNILAFQTAILHHDIHVRPVPGLDLGVRYRPLRRVGVCIPGGAAAYPSSLLMTVVPAQAAGVAEIAVVVPPTKYGGFNNDLLAACDVLGIREVYRVGGAQAIAALAYGVEGIAPVDKIVGPGNLFVALAKKHVFGHVDIDSIAGPSEVVVIADESARPRFVAADLISQAEHAPGASILISWIPPLLDRVEGELSSQLEHLSRGAQARDSLERFGALILARDECEAIRLANDIAPEHLHISTRNPSQIAERIVNAGAIFLGHFAPVALGDYAAGPSHVLPTGGTARWASGLSANDFLKRASLIQADRSALESLSGDVCRLADVEGLTAHRSSVEVRLAEPDSSLTDH